VVKFTCSAAITVIRLQPFFFFFKAEAHSLLNPNFLPSVPPSVSTHHSTLSLTLPLPGTSHKWNHTFICLCVVTRLIFLSLVSSRLILLEHVGGVSFLFRTE
jgi:hypothetical protein